MSKEQHATGLHALLSSSFRISWWNSVGVSPRFVDVSLKIPPGLDNQHDSSPAGTEKTAGPVASTILFLLMWDAELFGRRPDHDANRSAESDGGALRGRAGHHHWGFPKLHKKTVVGNRTIVNIFQTGLSAAVSSPPATIFHTSELGSLSVVRFVLLKSLGLSLVPKLAQILLQQTETRLRTVQDRFETHKNPQRWIVLNESGITRLRV